MSGHWKKQRLQDHFVVLCNDMDVDRIVPVLRAERMLTMDEMEQLTNPLYTTRARREKLLLFIPRKGKAHFEKFAECLVWSGQEDLARRIGVPVQDIRPSPHPLPQQNSSIVQQQEFVNFLQMMKGALSQTQPYPVAPVTAALNPQPTNPCINPSPHSAGHRPSNTAPRYPTQETNPTGDPHHPYNTGTTNTPPVAPPLVQCGCENVFILYCDDKELQRDFSESVEDLAAFLTRACGQAMKIHCDFYQEAPPGNWTRWTEQHIKMSDVVLMVCSPTLIRMLDNRDQHTERPVAMKCGCFDAETVYNLIEAPKFIPVFVNSYREEHFPDLYGEPYRSWIPTKLQRTSRYWIDLEGLHRVVGETDTDEQYYTRVLQVLRDEKMPRNLVPIADLLRSLQRTPGTQRPTPLPAPIHVTPAAHHPINPAPHLEPTRPELRFEDSELMTIAQRIPQDWQHLGIKLGLTYSTLENIRIKHQSDCVLAAMEMFSVWRRNKGELATRAVLRDALMSVGYGRVADDIFGRD